MWALVHKGGVEELCQSSKQAKTPEIIRSPVGLVFNHASEGLRGKGIAWAMKRHRHSTAVRVAVALMAPRLGTQRKSVTDKGADEFPRREGSQT